MLPKKKKKKSDYMKMLSSAPIKGLSSSMTSSPKEMKKTKSMFMK
jgi:hypothetical protein